MDPKDLYLILREKNMIVRDKNHNHICMFFPGNWKNFNLDSRTIISENQMLIGSFPYSIHAEINMLKKIQKCGYINRRKNYDIIVVRVSLRGKFGNSRPCFHCIVDLLNNNHIKIRYVYYSNSKGEIVREKLSEMLLFDQSKISSGYKFKHGNDYF